MAHVLLIYIYFVDNEIWATGSGMSMIMVCPLSKLYMDSQILKTFRLMNQNYNKWHSKNKIVKVVIFIFLNSK